MSGIGHTERNEAISRTVLCPLITFLSVVVVSGSPHLALFIFIFQGEERQGKRVRVTSPNREESIDETLPALHMDGPSQPHQWPQLGQDQSTNSSNDERNLVSFVDIMNAAEDAAN